MLASFLFILDKRLVALFSQFLLGKLLLKLWEHIALQITALLGLFSLVFSKSVSFKCFHNFGRSSCSMLVIFSFV